MIHAAYLPFVLASIDCPSDVAAEIKMPAYMGEQIEQCHCLYLLELGRAQSKHAGERHLIRMRCPHPWGTLVVVIEGKKGGPVITGRAPVGSAVMTTTDETGVSVMVRSGDKTKDKCPLLDELDIGPHLQGVWSRSRKRVSLWQSQFSP